MDKKARLSKNFELNSALLFAALTLGGATTAFAQQQAQPGSPFSGQAQQAVPAAENSGAAVNSPFRPTPSAQAAMTAFDRADTNKDGQLSAQEAAKLPAIGQRFKELDTDKNGSLSRTEFEKGANS